MKKLFMEMMRSLQSQFRQMALRPGQVIRHVSLEAAAAAAE